MYLKAISLAAGACALAGCATITRGKHEAYVVESEPGNAQVKLSTGETCDATPCSFRVKRKGAFDVTISKEGYKTTTYNVKTEVSGGGGAGMAGNVLLGGIIGAGVDATSGAMLDHKPNPLKVTLEATPVLTASATPVAPNIAVDANALAAEPSTTAGAASTTTPMAPTPVALTSETQQPASTSAVVTTSTTPDAPQIVEPTPEAATSAAPAAGVASAAPLQ